MPARQITNAPLPGQPIGPSHVVVAFTFAMQGGNGFLPHGPVLAVNVDPNAHDRYTVWTAYTKDGGLTWEVEQGTYLHDLLDAVRAYQARGGQA